MDNSFRLTSYVKVSPDVATVEYDNPVSNTARASVIGVGRVPLMTSLDCGGRNAVADFHCSSSSSSSSSSS